MSVDAVIFDWGVTLTPWKNIDGRSWWRIAARLADAGVIRTDQVPTMGAALSAAEEELWRRAREEHRSGTIAEVLAAAGIDGHPLVHELHAAEWEWATYLDPQ